MTTEQHPQRSRTITIAPLAVLHYRGLYDDETHKGVVFKTDGESIGVWKIGEQIMAVSRNGYISSVLPKQIIAAGHSMPIGDIETKLVEVFGGDETKRSLATLLIIDAIQQPTIQHYLPISTSPWLH